jgi:hypothetical protein
MQIYSCKDCTERVVGCHSTCEKYLKEKAEYAEENKKIYKEHYKENIMADVKKKGIHRMKTLRSNTGMFNSRLK